MKVIAGCVIIVLALHLQCSGSCLLSSFSRPEPPCHQHPAHESHSPCDQVLVIQSTVELPAILPAVIETSPAPEVAITVFNREKPPDFLAASIRSSVLRV